jgi:CheY-like chemotaxis protein
MPTFDEPPQRPRVLVVDDDERNLLAIETVLEDVGEIVIAKSGEEALRHLLKGEFAVILLDVYMPGIDGYETAQIIRSREQTKRIPIVFLSAVNKEAEHLIRGYSMGAVDYVFKPVDPVVLRSKVAVFVDLFAMTKEIQRKARQEQALLDANLKANAELLRAEQELRRAEQRQAAIIQSLPIILYLEPLDASPRVPGYVSGDLVAMTGYDYEFVLQNPSLCGRTGCTRTTATGCSRRSRRGATAGASRSNIAGSAPTAATSTSTIRPCCCAMARGGRWSSPAP